MVLDFDVTITLVNGHTMDLHTHDGEAWPRLIYDALAFAAKHDPVTAQKVRSVRLTRSGEREVVATTEEG